MTGIGADRRKGEKRLPVLGRRLLFLRVLAWAAVLPLLLRALSLPRLLKLLTPDNDPAGAEIDPAVHVLDAYVNFLLGLNRGRRGKNCLNRSLILYRFLRMRGVPARFVTGVRRENGGLQGHAWVEVDGRPCLEPEGRAEYEPTFSYPPLSGDNKP